VTAPNRIDRAQTQDLPAILELLRRAELPTDGLAPHIGTVLVARNGERIVGSAALELYGSGALLRSVAVADDFRGQGLGQALALAALDLARREQVRTVYLLTTTAAGFFPKLGFHTVDRRTVAADVQRSVEFTAACPASAIAMAREL
jgi:amino-acid N-acetyltransferase